MGCYFYENGFDYSVVMSEDMVKDGYENIMNIDISSVAIEMMRRKYECVPRLKCILLYYDRIFDSFFFSGKVLLPLFLFCYDSCLFVFP